jgi:hypothetical protein
MRKIDRHALVRAGIAGGANQGSSSYASSTSMVVVQVTASSSSRPAKH